MTSFRPGDTARIVIEGPVVAYDFDSDRLTLSTGHGPLAFNHSYTNGSGVSFELVKRADPQYRVADVIRDTELDRLPRGSVVARRGHGGVLFRANDQWAYAMGGVWVAAAGETFRIEYLP